MSKETAGRVLTGIGVGLSGISNVMTNYEKFKQQKELVDMKISGLKQQVGVANLTKTLSQPSKLRNYIIKSNPEAFVNNMNMALGIQLPKDSASTITDAMKNDELVEYQLKILENGALLSPEQMNIYKQKALEAGNDISDFVNTTTSMAKYLDEQKLKNQTLELKKAQTTKEQDIANWYKRRPGTTSTTTPTSKALTSSDGRIRTLNVRLTNLEKMLQNSPEDEALMRKIDAVSKEIERETIMNEELRTKESGREYPKEEKPQVQLSDTEASALSGALVGGSQGIMAGKQPVTQPKEITTEMEEPTSVKKPYDQNLAKEYYIALKKQNPEATKEQLVQAVLTEMDKAGYEIE